MVRIYLVGEKYTCIICGEKYDSTWDHVLALVGDCQTGYDKAHSDYGKKIADSLFRKPCFCGGHITQHATGEDAWETTCDDCEFLFDED